MKFLIDNQLPIALASFFRSKGFECKHVLEVGLDKSSDRQVWDLAESQQWIIISKDEDFLHLARSYFPQTARVLCGD